MKGWERTYRYGPVHKYSKIVMNGYAGGFAPHNVEECLVQSFGDKWRVPIGYDEWVETTLATKEMAVEEEQGKDRKDQGEEAGISGKSEESGGEEKSTMTKKKKKKKKKSVTTAVGEKNCVSLVAAFENVHHQPCSCYDFVDDDWWARYGKMWGTIYKVVKWVVVPLVVCVLLLMAVVCRWRQMYSLCNSKSVIDRLQKNKK